MAIPIKIMKNAFYFTLKALFVLDIFKKKIKFQLFSHVGKQLGKKAEAIFKI